jgi:hypothetical protein
MHPTSILPLVVKIITSLQARFVLLTYTSSCDYSKTLNTTTHYLQIFDGKFPNCITCIK